MKPAKKTYTATMEELNELWIALRTEQVNQHTLYWFREAVIECSDGMDVTIEFVTSK